MPQKRKSNKYVFTLPGINTDSIDKKYEIGVVSNIAQVQDNFDNVTKISELSANSNNISWVDESKHLRKCKVSMIDFSTEQDVRKLRYNCFWCRHKFDSEPLGCPIRYVSKVATKSYYSEISKDIYTIKQNIQSNKVISDMSDVTKDSYYETDGIFCSFPCTLAFILDNKHCRMYDNSKMLLLNIYNNLREDGKISHINSAPHWRLLQEYGGHMSISEFRNSFAKADYNRYGTTRNYPKFKSVGILYEEKIRF